MAVNINFRFVCEICDNVDDLHMTHQYGGLGYRCHRCMHGDWHNYMLEEKYDEVRHVCTNRFNPYFHDNGKPKF